MAVEIQEPNDIPGGSLTPATEDNYEILVYQKSEDAAGIKRMAISGWKDYLEFNSHKVNNVASYVGMPSDYPWNEDSDIPYGGTTVTNQIDTLATKLGISQEPGTFDPLYPRFQTVEDEVNGTGEPASGGLMQRMSQAETDIQSIEEEIGSSGGSSGSLTSRINALETTVGGSTSGLVKGVADINTEIGDDGTSGSIKGRIKVNEDNIASNTTDIGNLQATVGDSSSGLVKNVTDLQATVGDSNSGLVKQVRDLESKVYRFSGSIINVDDPDNTTVIILSDNTQINIEDLENGQVFDINPVSENSIKMTINSTSKTYSKGNNIAWTVLKDGTGYFDELGMNIDIEQLNNLQTDVNELKSYFQTIDIDSSWTSASIPSGIYQFSSVFGPAAGKVLSIFILSFDNTGSSLTTKPVDVSGNFNSHWEIDVNDTGRLKPKPFTGSRKLSIHRIGDV